MNNLNPEDLLFLRATALQMLAMKQRYKRKVRCEYDDTTNDFDSIMFKIRQIINEQYDPNNKDDCKLNNLLETIPKHLQVQDIFHPRNFKYNPKTHVGSIENNIILLIGLLVRIHGHVFKVTHQIISSKPKYILKRIK